MPTEAWVPLDRFLCFRHGNKMWRSGSPKPEPCRIREMLVTVETKCEGNFTYSQTKRVI